MLQILTFMAVKKSCDHSITAVVGTQFTELSFIIATIAKTWSVKGRIVDCGGQGGFNGVLVGGKGSKGVKGGNSLSSWIKVMSMGPKGSKSFKLDQSATELVKVDLSGLKWVKAN